MSTLQARLNTIGISGARGIDLMMQRDQIRATVSGEGGTAQSASRQAAPESRKNTVAPRELTPEEKRIVAELQQIDRRVRDHERAHLAAGRGVITSTADFTYTYGPDGRAYAIAGEVGIDTSPESKPEDNIYKGQRIQAAALAPRDPSPTDYRVASIGSQLELQGRSDLAQQRFEESLAAQEAARQERAARSEVPAQAEAPTQARPEGQADADSRQTSGQTQQILQNAYAKNGDASVDAGRVSVFA